MQRIKMIILAIALSAGLLAATVPVTGYAATNVFKKGCSSKEAKNTAVCAGVGKDTEGALKGNVTNVVNLLLYVLGIIAIIAIIIGGLRYVISGGDSTATKGAKDMILYAVVGLLVAILAFSIVNFVVLRFK